MRIGRRAVEISHPDKVLFPEDGITKAELAAYYRDVAPAMLPHVRGRPANLQRFPGGIGEAGFFQQEMPAHFPDWIESVVVAKEAGELRHVVIDDAETLVYLANLGCITPHVWLSRSPRLEQPDRMIFDLDPESAGDARVRHAALRLGALLRELGLVPFVKTSGSRGFHVEVPLRAEAEFDAVRHFADAVAGLLARHHAEQLTVETRKRQRRGRIYLDTLRNAYAHTAVPPFAVRARRGAPVALPVSWEELEEGVTPDRFRLRDVPELLAGRADPWRGWDRSAADLGGARERLDALLAEHGSPRRPVARDSAAVGDRPREHTAADKPSVRSPSLSRNRTRRPPR
jgi:bifunctional non-homologous end joining protein LigD